MDGASRIGLGTAQFGLDYGITNTAGKVGEAESAAILQLCADAGVDTIDTARLYGDSEDVIGRCAAAEGFRIVTKTPKFGDPSIALERAFSDSLGRLNRSSVYGLLFHDPADLLGPNGNALWRSVEALRDKGQVEKVGASTYRGAEVDALLELYPIDLVQVPWNPLDSRLEKGGQLQRLADRGVEIHARSLFLQGLLLQPSESIPERFGPIRTAVGQMQTSFAAAGLSPLEGLLASAFQRGEISRFIVGVTGAGEMEAILLAAEKAQGAEELDKFQNATEIDEVYLNPARWAELV